MSTERMSNRIEIPDDEPAPPPAKAQVPPEAAPQPKAEKSVPAQEQDGDGSDWVDIEDPKLKARFNRLYRHTKEANAKAEKTERQVALLAEQNRKLQTALETYAAQQKDAKTKAELAALKKEAKEALATGDTDAFLEVNERLTEIKQEVKKPEPEPAPQPQNAISDTEMKVLNNWQNQTDDDGEPARPWARPGHPEFAATQDMIRRVVNLPDMQDAPIREILAEVDRRMAKVLGSDDIDDEAPRNTVQRAFSSPRGERPRAQERTTLSAQERIIAEHMFMGGRGSLARTAKDAHELYVKQKRALGRVVEVED